MFYELIYTIAEGDKMAVKPDKKNWCTQLLSIE